MAAEALGGRALSASDEFFAPKDNLLKPGRGVFVEGKYTDRGKWMDGWESRRKRGAGHDHCIIELGAPGQVLGFDIDTSYFLGNHPPFASVDGVWAEPDTAPPELERMQFRELLAQVPLRPGSQICLPLSAASRSRTSGSTFFRTEVSRAFACMER